MTLSVWNAKLREGTPIFFKYIFSLLRSSRNQCAHTIKRSEEDYVPVVGHKGPPIAPPVLRATPFVHHVTPLYS